MSRSPESGVRSSNVDINVPVNAPRTQNATVELYSEFVRVWGGESPLLYCITPCSRAVLIFQARVFVRVLRTIRQIIPSDFCSVLSEMYQMPMLAQYLEMSSSLSLSSFSLFFSQTAEHLPSRRGPHP